tara:strand:+ start:4677 stop:5348 length:672 start_codon:yes stop_codon:yes gene_type:complete
MALQSSGQISLSQIAGEFGGSAPHQLSEYHDKGNAPASGEIQLAADFYGTSDQVLMSTSSESSATASLGNAVQLATGKIATGYYYSSGTTGLKFRTLTVSGNALNWNSLATHSIGTCHTYGEFEGSHFYGGTRWHNDSGVLPQASNYYKYSPSIASGFSESISWGGRSASGHFNSGWQNVPNSSVTDGTSVNVLTGMSFSLSYNFCGRNPYSHRIFYRSFSIT